MTFSRAFIYWYFGFVILLILLQKYYYDFGVSPISLVMAIPPALVASGITWLVTSRTRESSEYLQGIGGWLFFFCFMQVIELFGLTFWNLWYLGCTLDLWELRTKTPAPHLDTYFYLFGSSVVLGVPLTLFLLVLFYNIIRKRSRTPTLAMNFCIAHTLVYLIYLVIDLKIIELDQQHKVTAQLFFFRSFETDFSKLPISPLSTLLGVFFNVIFFFYFSMSKRVQNTFVR